MGFSGGSESKESTCNTRDLGSIPGLGRSPREGNRYQLQYSVWRITWNVYPWTHKESDMTKKLSFTFMPQDAQILVGVKA